jgi:putative colanic acid biosynthesis UDP-glucose lipid carrier transferase
MKNEQFCAKENLSDARRGEIIHSSQSGFSFMYRLVDMTVLTLLYFSALLINEININLPGMQLLLINIIVYNFSAEAMDLYRSWRTSSSAMMLKAVAIVWSLTGLLTVAFAFTFPDATPNGNQIAILSWLVVSLPTLLAWRVVMRKILHTHRSSGHNSRSAIIIGATSSGYNLANQIDDNPHLGIKFKAFFDDREPKRISSEFEAILCGTVDDAIALAKANQVDYIYVAMPMGAEKRITDILKMCSDTTANVYIIPDFFVYNVMNARWQQVGSIQTLSIFDTPFQGASDVLKRAEDIILSAMILCVIALPMLAIAIAIKLTSKGKVIFKQNRYGLEGKKISVYKFRSMTTQDNGTQVKQATKNDARITPLGAFLRRTSLDELPQFINVLQGTMSIVGPRPHAVAHNEEYRKIIDGYMLRHKVRPGITGWAQINGFRGETETINKMVKRVEYDLDYIHRWSVWLDMKIVFVTVFKGFVDKNAY